MPSADVTEMSRVERQNESGLKALKNDLRDMADEFKAFDIDGQF